MNIKALITTLVLGTSSVAMAASPRDAWRSDTSNSTSVRDHRFIAPANNRAPVAPNWNARRVSRPDYDRSRPEVAPAPVVTTPVAYQDCANWDPTDGIASNCGPSLPVATPTLGSWTTLASRDSSIGDHQFITVGPGTYYRELRLDSLDSRPQISKVAVRFTDGTYQTVQLGAVHCNTDVVIKLDGGRRQIDQIIIQPVAGSRGVYSMYAA